MIYKFFLDKLSFHSIPIWIEEISKSKGNKALVLIIGTKIDLADKRSFFFVAFEINILFLG